MRSKRSKGKNLLNTPVLSYMDVSVQLSVSCLFSSNKRPASLSCNSTAEYDEFPNHCRKCTYNNNNNKQQTDQTSVGHMKAFCAAEVLGTERNETPFVYRIVLHFNIASYCQLDSQWRNYTMLVFCLIIFQFLILQNIEPLLFLFYFNGRNLDAARFDWFDSG